MHPTLKDAKDWSTFKLASMIASTPVLKHKVAKPRSRDKTNTTLRKEYPGGYLMTLGSNSTSELRGRSAPIILCDEVDAYELTSEGDAINLLWKRANTFKDRKLVLTSTPTVKDISRIDQAWESSDKRRYYVPGPHCHKTQWLKWSHIKWDKDAEGKHLPQTTYYECEHFKEIYNVEYFHQLTVEKRVLRYKQGRPYHTYVTPSGARNEALDCRVYALAALYIVNPNMVPLDRRKTTKKIGMKNKNLGYVNGVKIKF